MRVKLSDVCVEGGIQTGPFGTQLHQSDYSEWGTPVCMPVNLVDGSISENGIARVSEEHVERLSRYKVKRGDLIYARRGDVGRGSLVGAREDGWLCGTGCLKVTPDPSKIDSRYLFYLTSLPETIGWLVNHAKGTTMLNLNTAILSSLPLVIEKNLEKQRRIAGVLSAYDELIENNRRQIKLLEEAAQRLYREWFIDLKFPGHETTPIVDGLPEGWQKGSLLDFADFYRGKSYTSKDLVESGKMRLANLNSIAAYGGWACGAEKPYAGAYKPEQLISFGDVIMAVTDMTKERRLVGHVARVPRQADGFLMSMDLIKFVPKNVTANYLYTTLRFSGVAEMIAMLANGTNVLHLKPDALDRVIFIRPDCEIQERFSETVESLIVTCEHLEQAASSAREARDRLLPKLMSGEIEV